MFLCILLKNFDHKKIGKQKAGNFQIQIHLVYNSTKVSHSAHRILNFTNSEDFDWLLFLLIFCETHFFLEARLKRL